MARTDFFLSHHQLEAGSQASLLAAALKQQGYRVFLDVDTHAAGDIASISTGGVSASRAVLVFVGRDFARRISSDDDWVALELRHARALGKPVIPILLDGFEFGAEQLPEEFLWITSQRGYRWDRTRLTALVEELRSALNLRTPLLALRSPRWSLAVLTLLVLLGICLWAIFDAATTILHLFAQASQGRTTLAACEASLASDREKLAKCSVQPAARSASPRQ